MTDVFDLEIRYAPQLEVAKKHLSSKQNNAGRSQLNPNKMQHLYDNNADCPICGAVFEGSNHNTEHIFPIALGGKNTMDNKIQLCVMCNNSRNQVMQAIIGNSPRSKYPGNWIQIKQTLLWHFITIDDGIKAGELIQTPHQRFMQYRTGGEPFRNRPKNAFGRFSTWKIGDPPNYIGNKHSPITKLRENPPEQFSWRLVGRNILDKFFGYEPKVKPPLNAKLADNIAKKPPSKEAHTKKSIPSDKSTKRIPNTRDTEGLVSAIIVLIGEDEVTGHTLARRVRKMQEENESMGTGTSSFLKHYGFPKNFGLVNALRACSNPKIIVDGDETEQKIRIQSGPQSIPKTEASSTSYPQVTHFNTASGASYALPRHPQQFIECMIVYSSNQTSLNSYQEIFDTFYPILGGRKRTDALASKLASILIPDDKSHQDEKDWGMTRPVESPLQLSEEIRSLLLDREKNSSYSVDLVPYINQYFDIVSTILQGSNSDDAA